MGLNPRHRKFVAEYLISKNATQAAIRAGYSKKTAYAQGCRLLKNAEIAAAIKAGAEKQLERLDLKADDILRELLRIGMSDVSKAFDPETGNLLPLHQIPEDTRRAIASVENEELWDYEGEDHVRTGNVRKLKFWNKNQALEALGKHLKLFVDRVDHHHALSIEIVDPYAEAKKS